MEREERTKKQEERKTTYQRGMRRLQLEAEERRAEEELEFRKMELGMESGVKEQ